MKNTIFFGSLAIIMSLSFASCDIDNDNNDHFLNGTWVGIVGFFSWSGCDNAPNCEHNGLCHGYQEYEGGYTFNNGTWEFFSEFNFLTNRKGTYTTSSGKITMTITHYKGTYYEELDDLKYYSKNEMEKALKSSGKYTDDQIFNRISVFTTYSYDYTVNGNKLILITNIFGDELILKKIKLLFT